jgi:DNA-binding transcriptional ArsR family regulator
MVDINEVLLNPVRMRIIQQLAVNAEMTAAELGEKMNDVPRTTLYRHINVLLENNILTIVSEKRIRGSLERTLALNIEEITSRNQLENAPQQILSFLMNRYARYHNYFYGENPDPARDRIFCNDTILMMDDKEFEQFLNELRDLLIKYSFEADHERKARDISVLSVPVEKE